MLIALCITLCYGVVAQARQSRLSENIIRLHVIAVSDSKYEQQLKLRVRDAVSGYLTPIISDCSTPEQAAEAINDNLEGIELAALSASEGRGIAVEFGRESYGTRVSGPYTLPAGEYSSLRVTIGSGEGHNWWGVIFPQLTDGTVSDYESAVNLIGEDNITLITEGEDGRVIRFKLLEWFEALRGLFSK